MHQGLHSWGMRSGFLLCPLPPEALLFPGKPQECLHPSAAWKCKATAVPWLAARTQLSRNNPSRWEMWPDCRYHIQLLGWEAPRKKNVLKGLLCPREPENPCRAGSVVADLWALVGQCLGYLQLEGLLVWREVGDISAPRLWSQRHGQAGLVLPGYFCPWAVL